MNTSASHTYKSHNKKDSLTQGLGWLSVALGAAELIAPGGLASCLGVKKRSTLFRLLGLRELASGIGILSQPKSAPWLWSRVAGDAMDLALLATAFFAPGRKQAQVARTVATASVLGVTVLDVMASKKRTELERNGGGESGMFLKKNIIIDRSQEELYRFWRNFENLPRFMYYLESVQVSGPTRSRWVAKGPGDVPVEWEAEITEEKPNELIAWRSVEGSKVENSGRVRFSRAPGGRGTLVDVEMQYQPPAGPIGVAVAKLFHREPKQQVQDSLRFFKQLMETGTIITTKGQPAGRKSSTSRKFDYQTPQVVEVAHPEFAFS